MPLRIKVAVGFLFLILVAIFISFLVTAFKDDDSNFEKQYNTLVRPYTFNVAGWEVKTLYDLARQHFNNTQPESSLNSESVLKYFALIDSQNKLKSEIQSNNNRSNLDLAQQSFETEDQITSLRPIVEQTLENQISQSLAKQGIYNPISNQWPKITLPPVNFVLENPPHVLIVSPRNKIERIRDTMLIQDINLNQVDKLELSLEKLNVSALVEEIGGLGATYPSFVESNSDLRFTINTAIEEWLHQYLAFKPLGFRYILDLLSIYVNSDIPTLNETAASLMSKELGGLVYANYYPQEQAIVNPPAVPQSAENFDFNKEMRDIRTAVDKYLTQGQIDQAEQFMKEKRQYLEANGYYIRKLNQAYFAFYGSYADSPTSVDLIGDDLLLLRKNSSSIKQFLDIVSTLGSREDLVQVVKIYKQ
jgi:hypothetical protein